MRQAIRTLAVAGVVAVFASGCMTYGGFPPDTQPQAAGQSSARFHYAVDGSSVFNGHLGVRDVLQNETPFADPEEIRPTEPTPGSGAFIRATITTLPPSVPAAAWGYVSGATLAFLLPAASTQDGYRVTYELYQNGQRQRRASYEFHRKTLVWLPMVVVSWVNFFTPSEKEAFEATARQFLAEAYPGNRG